MINLIKNEIVKIFHKKSFRVMAIIVLLLVTFSLILDISMFKFYKDDYITNSYEMYKENLDSYDLTNREEAKMYAEDKAMVDTFALLKKYPDQDSGEYYYIDNEINQMLVQMYYAKYVNNDLIEYEKQFKEYERMLDKLDDFDWRKFLKEEKTNYLNDINNLEKSKNSTNQEDISKQIETLNISVKAIDYRLKYDIPYSYSSLSSLIDDYESYGIQYLSMNQNEEFYKRRDDLVNKRNVEKEYKVAEYKLENNVIYDSEHRYLIDDIVYMFMYVDMIILLVIMIVVGGVVADEFNKGTIKQLLVRPFSRSKILLSKIIASMIMVMLFAILYYFIYIVAYSIYYSNFSALFSSVVDYNFNTHSAFEMNVLLYCIVRLLAILPQYVIMFIFVLFISIVSASAVGAIGAGFGLIFISETVKMMLPAKYLAYLPTYCWDWSSFLFGGVSDNEYLTFTKAIIVCVVTVVLLVIGSFLAFKKKDIKNQ